MIVDQTASLHKGIAYSRADEIKAAFFQIFADHLGDFGFGGNFRQIFPTVFNRFSADEIPDVFVERAEFFLNFQKCF